MLISDASPSSEITLNYLALEALHYKAVSPSFLHRHLCLHMFHALMFYSWLYSSHLNTFPFNAFLFTLTHLFPLGKLRHGLYVLIAVEYLIPRHLLLSSPLLSTPLQPGGVLNGNTLLWIIQQGAPWLIALLTIYYSLSGDKPWIYTLLNIPATATLQYGTTTRTHKQLEWKARNTFYCLLKEIFSVIFFCYFKWNGGTPGKWCVHVCVFKLCGYLLVPFIPTHFKCI